MKKYEELMQICLNEAEKYRFSAAPNPMVAAIVYDEAEDKIVSIGAHKKYGEAHAEPNTINAAGGCDFSDKTLIVNLEPCSHFGKTPPCADLIIQKGFKKVVIGTLDPNPEVSGMGVKKIKEAGIEVIEGILEDRCRDLNKVFFKNVLKKMPYVMVKTATTFDSKIATSSGQSKWITGDEARCMVRKLRSEHFGILCGSGTVLADNPALTTRIEGAHEPDRIIIDRSGKIPFDYRVFMEDGARVFLATNNFERDFPKNVIPVEFKGFRHLFSKLYEYGVYSVFVETGKSVLSAILAQKQADEIYKFVSAKIFGSGLDFVGNMGILKIDDCIKLDFYDIEKVGQDILIKAKILNAPKE